MDGSVKRNWFYLIPHTLTSLPVGVSVWHPYQGLIQKILVGGAKQAKLDGAYMHSAESHVLLLGGLGACPQKNFEN